MTESSLSSSGAKVVLVSSSDENHPPENILDGSTKSFWISTGMFPQEFIIRFPHATKISVLTIHSYNIKGLKLEKCMTEDTEKFENVAEKELERTDSHLQINDVSLNTTATHLRFIITSGYDHFVSVHSITV
ncbi:intraflagellar transport protein 25 homolog [Denticeps clupeoides]|uniref:F5/8 type C domain-containing protein n=1 Tax=Denticeps clupeoides TaxID=299321 RepID=A0AAY4C2Q3_9TELE|nr:intraflagellar transport protein 25 homolog [Denticeps clupeoides]